MVFVGENEAACFYVLIALDTDAGPILGRFWSPKSLQNRPKIGSERCPASCSFLNAIQDLQKSIFEPTWPQHGPILPPKTAPSWGQNGLKIGPKTVLEAKSVPEPILDRFGTDFGAILARFWDDFCSILGLNLVDFWGRFRSDFRMVFDRFLVAAPQLASYEQC